jgi:CTP synthase (UTP-ammonia lyase)
MGKQDRVLKIAIIGDFKSSNITHQATNKAIVHAAQALGSAVESTWIPTPELAQEGVDILHTFDGLWCSPGSPYANMDGAIRAIRFAREANRPFFAT